MNNKTPKSPITNHQSTIYINSLSSTPLGRIWFGVTTLGLAAVEIGGDQSAFEQIVRQLGYSKIEVNALHTPQVAVQIREYLEGIRKQFDLSIDWSGMKPFQEKVLRATLAIPYGQVATYGEIAQKVGIPRAAIAVGRAQATNPIPLVIPCHRVIGSDGKLHGYRAPDGVKTKAWLLRMEGYKGS